MSLPNNPPHVGCLVPIRLRSERLPGKALMPICGKPVVHHLLDRIVACQQIASPLDVVVCMTEDASDDPLEVAVRDYGASVYRGETDDIIARFHGAVTAFGFDVILQVDGDDPICDTGYMARCIQALLDMPEIDVVTCSGLPLGVASKAFTRKAMDEVFARYRTRENDTGFAYFFTKSGMFKIREILPSSERDIHDSARLTLDYEADFILFQQIFERLYMPGSVFTVTDVVALLNAEPALLEINAGLDDIYKQRTLEKALLSFVDSSGMTRRIDPDQPPLAPIIEHGTGPDR